MFLKVYKGAAQSDGSKKDLIKQIRDSLEVGKAFGE